MSAIVARLSRPLATHAGPSSLLKNTVLSQHSSGSVSLVQRILGRSSWPHPLSLVHLAKPSRNTAGRSLVRPPSMHSCRRWAWSMTTLKAASFTRRWMPQGVLSNDHTQEPTYEQIQGNPRRTWATWLDPTKNLNAPFSDNAFIAVETTSQTGSTNVYATCVISRATAWRWGLRLPFSLAVSARYGSAPILSRQFATVLHPTERIRWAFQMTPIATARSGKPACRALAGPVRRRPCIATSSCRVAWLARSNGR